MPYRYLLQLSRPRFWIYLIGPIVVALAAARTVPDSAAVILLLYATLPANLLIYGVNDIFDRATDALNTKKDDYEARLVVDRVRPLVWTMFGLNLPFVVVLSIMLSDAALPWLLVFLITGIGYSMPPLRFKTKPVLDAISNILYVALGFAAYAALTGQQPALQIVIAAGLWCMAMHAYSAVPDISADRAAGLQTIATTFGRTATLSICAGLYAVAAALSYRYIGWFAVVAGVVYLVLMAASLRTKTNSQLFRLYKVFPATNSLLGMGLFFVVWFIG